MISLPYDGNLPNDGKFGPLLSLISPLFNGVESRSIGWLVESFS